MIQNLITVGFYTCPIISYVHQYFFRKRFRLYGNRSFAALHLIELHKYNVHIFWYKESHKNILYFKIM